MIHCSLSSTMFKSRPIVGSEILTPVRLAVYNGARSAVFEAEHDLNIR